MESSSSSSSPPYAQLLEKLRLPVPAFQRHAVISIFDKLRAGIDSDPARDALARCLTSPSCTVIDQSVRELCRLAVSSSAALTAPRALVELQSVLEGCDPKLVPVLAKGIGFLCRFAFRTDECWGRTYSNSPELHPFVKVLSCRTEACDELVQQVLLFIVQNINESGIDAVSEFLRPFLMFAVLKVPSSSHFALFVKDLMSSMASLSCSFPNEAVSIISLLMTCLKMFPLRTEKEFRYLLSSAGYIVDSFIAALKQFGGKEKFRSVAATCTLEMLGILLPTCLGLHSIAASDTVFELSMRLLIAHKTIGLQYLPEFASIILSTTIILIQVELEHEQLSALKFILFLIEWKNEICRMEGEPSIFSQELLLIFPAINLISSPSRSVSAAATQLLSALEKPLFDQLVTKEKVVQFSEGGVASVSRPDYVISRLLHHLCSREKHTLFCLHILLSYHEYMLDKKDGKSTLWPAQLREYYLTFAKINNVLSPSQSKENVLSGTHLLLCSIACILVTHNELGVFAVDFLATLGSINPKVSMSLLLTVLFFIKIFCSFESHSKQIMFKLLEMLPSLASHSVMTPLIVQTIMQMLSRDAEPVLYATAVRLLCKTWMATDRCFGSLHETLDEKMLLKFTSKRDISISLASSACDVCKHNADRGVDLILFVAACIESREPSVQALGLESVAYLCEADVVDFYTAWNVVGKDLLDYKHEPLGAYSLCRLLRWGALDVEAYPEDSKAVIQILWEVGTSRKPCSSLWSRAQASAFKSLSHFEVVHLQDNISNFKDRNVEFLVSEHNSEVLEALESLQINIINFEHMTRRRMIKGKGFVGCAYKIEKLLSLFPQAMFPSGDEGNYARDLPGAALLSFSFSHKELHGKGTSKDLPKLQQVFENKLLEIAESLQVSRNIFFALLSVQSWKAFIGHWIKALSTLFDRRSTMLDSCTMAATDVFKILCKYGDTSIPRVAENMALAIGALCMVVEPSAHSVVSSASDFLLKWLSQKEHEHKQWCAAISLGFLCNCLHRTDRAKKYDIISGLLQALNNCESYLVIGACGVGLGFSTQDIPTRSDCDDDYNFNKMAGRTDTILLGKIVRSLSFAICNICPSAANSLERLYEHFSFDGENIGVAEAMFSSCGSPNSMEGDIWGVAGLVMGLGNSATALYKSGAHDAVIRIKDMLLSWIPFVNPLINFSDISDEMPKISLSMGSSIALPILIAFCQRVELSNNDIDSLLSGYKSLILELLHVKGFENFLQNLVMTLCIGAGSLLSSTLHDGLHVMKIDNVKSFLEVIRSTYIIPYPPIIQFGGMLGIVNAFGASAGILSHPFSMPLYLHSNFATKEASYISGPILANHALASFCTSIIQELFMLAKNSTDQQIRGYAAWSISLLRYKLVSKELQDENGSDSGSVHVAQLYQGIAEDSLISKFYMWLMHLQTSEISAAHNTTIVTVLRCLTRAPRLPASSDWGPIIRRCMRHVACFSGKPQTDHASRILREECLLFSLAHARHVDSLLAFLDEISDISRFKTLELNLQLSLLCNLADLINVLSVSRQERLCYDFAQYFMSLKYCNSYEPRQKYLMRISFWKGINKCLTEAADGMAVMQNIEKCMEILVSQLPLLLFDGCEDETNIANEWKGAVQCLAKARHSWLKDMLLVTEMHNEHNGILASEIGKRISLVARLVMIGHLPASELGTLKALLLNAKPEGLWNALIEVAAAIYHSQGNVRRQWLMDAADITTVSKYPSTALRFIGILSGSCCHYMPLLILDPVAVLRDLPVTLPALFSDGAWAIICEPFVAKLWVSTERIYTWANQLDSEDKFLISDHIDASENHLSALLANVMLQTCLSMKDYLPFEKQLKLANMHLL